MRSQCWHGEDDLFSRLEEVVKGVSPKNIPEIEERLRSRFEWGLIADIQPPDFETRVALLKKKAALERVLLADDVAYLMATLADLWGDEETIIPIEVIQRKAAEFFRVRLSDLKAKDRTKAVAFPRQIAMYVARQLTHVSLAEIGRAFGGKDHTTVLHAIHKIQNSASGKSEAPEDHRWPDPRHRPVIAPIVQALPIEFG